MEAERWKRVDDLLQSALQLPAGRQEDFLRQQCGGDSELLEEVRSLLTSHRKAGSFLESPGLHVAAVAGELPTLGVTHSGSSSFTGQTISGSVATFKCRQVCRRASVVRSYVAKSKSLSMN